MLPALILLVAAAASPSTDVEIAIAAAAPAAQTSVREDLEDLLTRRGLAARYRLLPAVDRDEVLRPAAEAPCALACVWIDLGVAQPGRAFVYISATASAQVVIRSLPLPRGVDEVAREEVAHIVATSVEALQAGRPLPVSSSPDGGALAKTAPAAPPPAPRALRFVAGVGVGAAHEGASQLASPQAGLSLIVAAERRLSPALWLTLGAFSSDAAGDGVALRFRVGELAALGAIGTGAGDTRSRRLVARLGVGPGVELRQVVPATMAGAAGVMPDAARLDPSVFVRAAARVEVGLFGGVGLFFAAACDARVVSTRYTVERDAQPDLRSESPVFQPDLLRPSFMIGVDARLDGEASP